MKKILFAALTALSYTFMLDAQGRLSRTFSDAVDSLSVLAAERTTVDVELKLNTVNRRGDNLDFYFSRTLGDLPWHEEDVTWFKGQLKALFPEQEKIYGVGNVFANGIKLEELVTPHLGTDGLPEESVHRKERHRGHAFVERADGPYYEKGLSGRHIALWQSHGRFYDEQEDCWKWQRAREFTTVEDMYTQSYVIPFLMPMLENAGAYVMSPRERDPQKYEAVVDNDPSFPGERKGLTRRSGTYEESGDWTDAGEGFADMKEFFIRNDNPFTMGKARKTKVRRHGEETARAVWTPDIPQRGEYAVYVSYKSFPHSTGHAHYTVRHLGGESEFSVNQKIGGGTWIYLGTFEFAPDGDGAVILDNAAPAGREHEDGQIVSADAVRFGGGMGKIARGKSSSPAGEWKTSGLPAYAEGALYSMQWSGIDSTVTRLHKGDYTNDFADRGPWVAYMAGGSSSNPVKEGKGIPFDLSFALHSDAGSFPNDSIVGTLAIYTLKSEGSRKLPDGGDRMICRELCDYVQTQTVNDIRAKYDSSWARRGTWDRSYSEARTGEVPGMILELLSHQNFADMRYGLDPEFRFDVSRAIYKGILKFLSNRYGCGYEVQPLPVRSFSAILKNRFQVRLSWEPTVDSLEETAVPKGFLLYTRIDGGAFDNGRAVEAEEKNGRYGLDVDIEPGHIYSFKIKAYNDGGESFPSEILSTGTPESPNSNGSILIVNNFYRVSAPTWFDTPQYAGFDDRLDGGVPYIKDISYIGRMYEFRREREWESDDNPGFGASYSDMAGFQQAGNSFDYPYIHGKAVLSAGYSFSSCSADAFASEVSSLSGLFSGLDLICGKQLTTVPGKSPKAQKYELFPKRLRSALEAFSKEGGDILVSGANIGTDIWDSVYPIRRDEKNAEEMKRFAKDVLGYRWVSNWASRNGSVRKVKNRLMDCRELPATFGFHNEPNEETYCVETPDSILPSDDNGTVFLRYEGTDAPAAVCSRRKGYRTVCFGFPLESMKNEAELNNVMSASLVFFTGKN